MSQWLQSAKATVSAGAAVISFTDNKDFASVRAGDVVMINGQIWQCASGTRPDSAGKSTVTLAAPWPYTGASNVNAFVFRTTHDLLQLTSDARKLTNITKALLAAQEDILKGTTPTINVPIGLNPATGNEDVIAVTPWQYVINVVNASLGNISAIGAMSQAQFEAIRAQNNENYAASGFVHFGKDYAVAAHLQRINQGLWTAQDAQNLLMMGRGIDSQGASKTEYSSINIAGVNYICEMLNIPDKAQAKIKFPQAPDGKTTYNKSTGVNTVHATVTAAFNAQASDPTNVEVVTDRVDMWGFEAWLEEVNATNPYVYPNGLIQSHSATMDGITTSASARPVTYYAVFDGDTGSKGKGFNYFALSDTNKKKVLGNAKNNLYYLDDGRLVQWRLRQRTIAGAGNGDWVAIDTTVGDALNFTPKSRVQSQGGLDSVAQYTDSFITDYISKSTGVMLKEAIGAFGIRGGNTGVGINGECYFLVCGTVNRLNQGAYHPSFNSKGTSTWWRSTTDSAPRNWYESTSPQNSLANCFGEYNRNVGFIGGVSGRPDGRLYDAIYADGGGGVCRDMRYSAYGVDSVDFADADQRVKNGTYRGFEKAVFSKAYAAISSNCTNGLVLFKDSEYAGWVSGYVQAGSGSGLGAAITSNKSNSAYVIKNNSVIAKGYFSGIEETLNGTWFSRVLWDKEYIPAGSSAAEADSYLVITSELNTSVGGSFLQTDVIGNPENILATPALVNGWQGSWGGIAEPGGVDKVGTRKNINGGELKYTVDNGVSWSKGTFIPNYRNNVTSTYSDSDIRICQYQAFAKQTENATNAVVYGGDAGVGNVINTAGYLPYYGALWMEALIGRIAVGAGNICYRSSLSSYGFFSNGRLLPDPDYPILHNQVIIGVSNNNSPAVKALNYNVNINQQAFIQYAYTELKYDGTNWGDDGKVTIVDNQSTKTDLNGNTVLVGTAKLKEPIGWIKNKV